MQNAEEVQSTSKLQKEKSKRKHKRKLSQTSGNYRYLTNKNNSEKIAVDHPEYQRPRKVLKKWWRVNCATKETTSSISTGNINELDHLHIRESKKEQASFPSECDDVVRTANIYLCLQHIDSMPEFLNECDWAKHWILVFEFDNRIISFEVAQTIEGKKGNLIQPSFKDDCVIEVIKSPYFIETIKTSPKKVRDAAANNRYNNKKYLAGTQNCQEWIKDLCKALGVTTFPHSTFKETVPLLALAANSSSPIIKQMFAHFHMAYSYCLDMSFWDFVQYLPWSLPIVMLIFLSITL